MQILLKKRLFCDWETFQEIEKLNQEIEELEFFY